MKKPMLNIIPVSKEIQVGNKTIKIPKLGLKHYRMLKDVKGLADNLTELMDSICPGLNAAEAEFVIVHLLAHNNRIKEVQEFRHGETTFAVDIKDMVICNKTEFQDGDKTYRFRAPKIGEYFTSGLHALQSCTLDGIDYGEMPAYMLDWADDITATVKLETSCGTLNGAINIIGKTE